MTEEQVEHASMPAADAPASAVPPLRIRGLRLIGPHRTYSVDFTDNDNVARQLSVIAGEISTGKTSILQLIDYCLGAKDHPEHDEIIAKVRTAHLSIEVREVVEEADLDGGTNQVFQASRYIIERPIGSVSKVAWLLHGDLENASDLPPGAFRSIRQTLGRSLSFSLVSAVSAGSG